MKIVQKSQPNDRTCVHTCLSMITGVPIEKLVDRFGDNPLGFDEAATVLVEHGIFPTNTTGCPHQFLFPGFYLVACASKNFLGLTHQIIVKADEDGYVVYDPQQGREGKEVWTGDDIMQEKMARAEVLYLDTDVLRKMKPKNVINHE